MLITKSTVTAIATPNGWLKDHDGQLITFASARHAQVYMKLEGITGDIREYAYRAVIRPLPDTTTTGYIVYGMFGRSRSPYTRALHEMIIGT